MSEKETYHGEAPRALVESPNAPASAYTTARTSADTVADPEVQRENARHNNPNGFTRTESGVDVKSAEAEFATLQRELTGISQTSRHLSRTHSRQSQASKTKGSGDVEKVATSESNSEGEQFDLEGTLRGNQNAERDAGIRSKHIGVIWDGLTVTGAGGVTNFVKTFPDAFVSFFNVIETGMNIFGIGKKGRDVKILDDFRGVVTPGEMVLVLGRPGSGCTTFLKVIANQRFGYTGVDGEVLYGPFDAKTFAKQYRGEAVYNQEDDVHHPTLTVGQTLGFALDTKTPGKRPDGLSKAAFKDKVITTFLRMFNIEHTRNTIVGNQFVRGVSGGERKRVSIAEMMVTSATVCAWDNSTRGLDASTALDYAKSLRVMTNIYKTTTFVSLYQASENIYKQFDKVLVIDDGREVYFGPAKEARSYFEGLGFKEKPRQTSPDFLTGCTDEFEREYADGRTSENAPHSPETLAKAFNDSKYAKLLDDEMVQYRKTLAEDKQRQEDFQVAVHDSKRRGASKKSVYSIPFFLQVWTLMQRQYLIKWQDKFSLVVSWITSIVVAIVLGTVWLNLPKTSAGAFTRGGLLFISLLFNAFQAFSELASTMIGRPIVNKHKAYTFHRPSALWIAQILVDVAFSAIQIFVFSVIVYFMCGLVRDAGAFFTFYLVIVSGYLAMTLFFRTVGCVCPDFDYAIKFAATIITFFVITSGYLIQYQSEKVWLRWIYWINALGLGFAALMENEFSRIDLTCTSESLVPSGPGYNNISHQVCTLPGSVSGTNTVSGSAYITQGFAYPPSELWRNWGIILVLIVGFLFSNAMLGEWITFGAGGNTAKVFQKPNKEREELNAALVARRDARRSSKNEAEGSELNINSKAILTWEGLNYDVPTPAGQLRLLNNIYGYVQPGELTALMGASGAGKTTLLDVLASRKNIGVISGDVLVDGIKPGTSFQRGTSYAEQLDVHEPTQTVREALRFSADLRQPIEVPQAEKYAYVEEVLSLLEMEDMADAIIGDPESGLAVEQRKRVTIGVELAAKPELLLFLDEPTSGLDSQSAFNIVRFLKKLANAGQAILCTIHQPNAALFENFDRLLLLQKGGQTVYFGDIGKDAVVLLDYLSRHGAHCPHDANPAEYMLDAIGAGQAARVGDRDWGEIFAESPELANIKDRISQMKAKRLEEVGSHAKVDEKEFATPLLHQLKTVQKRTNLSFWRSPNYGFTRLFNHVIISIITGLAYLHLDDSRSSLQFRVFVIFQVTVLPALILAQVEPKYAISRMIFYREASSKMYGQFAFASSLVVAEMPYSILCAVGFFLPLYYMPGFQHASSRAGYQFLMILITELFSVTLGQMVAAITPSPFISALLNPFIIITFALFCGVTIPKAQIPKFWRAWLYELDPFTRLIGGMVVTELHDRPVICTSGERNHFSSPSDQNCGDYMKPFFRDGGAGYIIDNATQACEYCAYKIGDQFYTGLDLNFDNRWRDLGIFLAFVGSNLILLFLGSRYLNFNRR
ncbi:ABC transporter G family member [Lachnellula hyalina]|uniref:ABC transporter G family member n=1 Tax=Lachnellula hyalina TaxID=1316788 RepID=A0A8H8R6V4_9HELO|nr:ABC transporter G family member [Lachnellula hyalina]TVY28686.1 ABC transporter G family member [Lachnellula hyalina]